jgi:hypothetical protein
MTGLTSFTIQWLNSQIYQCGSWNFAWSNMVHLARNNVPYSVEPQNTGGFEYLMTPFNSAGISLTIRADIYSYQGIQPPALFVSRNALPVLERFDFKNESSSAGSSRWFSDITINTPGEGWYGLGVFLYGTSTNLVITANWVYNLPLLNNNEAFNATIRGNAYYMVQDIPRASELLVQVSRAAPGGIPMVYFSSAGFASPLNFDFLLDTTQTTYVTRKVDDPAPMYLVTVTCANQIDTFGFLTKLSW